MAASAVAGYILPGRWETPEQELKREFIELTTKSPAEKVEILEGFPAEVKGRLIFVPQDNLNTDGIYGKDYTYREDMTRELMAKVIFENYDPEFSAKTNAGDVVVGGFNFGTGSSREQAVTALQAKGLPLVIAGSFSQTYLRNAFNNGFLCVECPEFVTRLRKMFADAKEKTVIPQDGVEIDFTTGTITYEDNGSSFRRWEQFRSRW